MKIFKNKVGRPSKETLRKRKIFKGAIVIAIVAVLSFSAMYITNFLANNDISSIEKNALETKMYFSDYSGKNPKLGNAVSMKLNVKKNSANSLKYLKVFYYDSEAKKTSVLYNCTKIAEKEYSRTIRLSTVKKHGSYKQVTASLYAYSDCKTAKVTKQSDKIVWTSTPTITFNGYPAGGKLTVGETETTHYTITGAKGLYKRIFLQKNGYSSRSSCIPINSDGEDISYKYQKETLAYTYKNIVVQIYSDSSCSKSIALKSSPIIRWYPKKAYPTSGTIKIELTNQNSNNTRFGTSKRVYYKVTNGLNKYYKLVIYSQNDKDNRTLKTGCHRIPSNPWNQSIDLKATKAGAEKQFAFEIYKDSNCSNLIAGKFGTAILFY